MQLKNNSYQAILVQAATMIESSKQWGAIIKRLLDDKLVGKQPSNRAI